MKCRKTAGKFRDRAISKSKRGSADEMRRKLVNEHREQEERKKSEIRERKRDEQCKRESKRNGAAAVGETFVLEGKDYVCE